MKYARIVNGRTVDTTDLSVYDPRPEWGKEDSDLMDRIFSAVGGFAAFVVVPNSTENGMEQKPDGSYGWPEPATEEVAAP